MWSRADRVAGAVLVAIAACSGDARITVTDARAPAPPTDRIAAVYLTIDNEGDGDDALIGVTSDAADTVTLHQTVFSSGSVEMRPVDSLEVARGDTLVFEPGGLHIMLIGLARMLEEGDELAVTLEFARSDPVEVTVEVTAGASGDGGGG